MDIDIQKILFPLYEAQSQRFYLASITSVDENGFMETRIQTLLAHIPGLSNVRKKFLTHSVMLFLSVRSRINFLNMARYGTSSEKTYRTHFEQPFAFWDFNTALIQQTCSSHRIIAGDCTYLPKSGKHTPNLGTFWNGCVSKAMPGLELNSVAVVDVDNRTAFHLLCDPTPGHLTENESRIDFSVKQIITHAADLKAIADYIVHDGAAGKKKFVDGIVEHTDLHLVSKLRHDADLRYRSTGSKRPGPGRPKKYDGKINWLHPDFSRFERGYEDEQKTIYTAIVNSKRFKRNIRIAYIRKREDETSTILFSTDLNLNGYLIYLYYHLRFQIELLFRDAKQYTGLTHCQGRSENKLSFHHNLSLTAVSLAKAECYAQAQNRGKPFSMADVKTVFSNQLYLEYIFHTLDISPTCETIAPFYHELLNFGRAVA